MRVFKLLPILCLLAACGAQPAPQFFNAERHDLTLDGIEFAVFLTDNHAEVIRKGGYLPMVERDRVLALMQLAAEKTAGCPVAGVTTGFYRSPSLPGDMGEARFLMAC